LPRDFASVRSILARERELGQPLPKQWKLALKTLADRQAREILKSTRQARRDGYEWRESKMRALA